MGRGLRALITSKNIMAKTLAIVFGIVFVVVGLLGFVPNPLVGEMAIFETDMMHNLVHLLFGVILLVVAYMYAGSAALWLKILGVVYLVLAVLGFLMIPEGGKLLGLVHTSMSDHWLHIVLGIVLVAAGFAAKRSVPMATGTMPKM
ncbi:DUF4383 domain-containing protein [Candidatus Parcubacteria bacterium]|nr:DUF4383 domain-containing protein [Candidatus Parcubacteria bacterium]